MKYKFMNLHPDYPVVFAEGDTIALARRKAKAQIASDLKANKELENPVKTKEDKEDKEGALVQKEEKGK